MAIWMVEEMKAFEIRGAVFAYDSDTEEFIGAFNSYKDFRNELPGAEVVMVEDLGYGVAIYC